VFETKSPKKERIEKKTKKCGRSASHQKSMLINLQKDSHITGVGKRNVLCTRKGERQCGIRTWCHSKGKRGEKKARRGRNQAIAELVALLIWGCTVLHNEEKKARPEYNEQRHQGKKRKRTS